MGGVMMFSIATGLAVAIVVGLSQVAQDRAQHLLDVDRLGDEVVHARVDALFALGGHHVSRTVSCRERPDAAGESVS